MTLMITGYHVCYQLPFIQYYYELLIDQYLVGPRLGITEKNITVNNFRPPNDGSKGFVGFYARVTSKEVARFAGRLRKNSFDNLTFDCQATSYFAL